MQQPERRCASWTCTLAVLLIVSLLLVSAGASSTTDTSHSHPARTRISWATRAADHVTHALKGLAVPAAPRRILAVISNSTCQPSSLLPEFDCQLEVTGNGTINDSNAPPSHKHYIHWSLDPSGSPGIRFGVLVNPEPIDASKPPGASNAVPPGWVGLGWSAINPQNAPPQMINGTAVMGWLDSTGQQRVGVYDLWSKSVKGIVPSEDGFTVTDTSVELTPAVALLLRFRRSFDATFTLNGNQRMITAHHHVKSGIIRHNHRAAVVGAFAYPGSIRVVKTRLNSHWVQAHAWCMIVVFAILFPAGIIWARYFRDAFRKWFVVHIMVQITGMAIAVAALIIAVTKNRPLDTSLNHFQLGIAVITLVLLQPFSSIPRLMMHHSTEMKSVAFAYVHWTLGRAALVFGFVNMYFGIGRYRTEFGLGHWSEALLSFWIAGLVIICLVGETRLWVLNDIRLREDNDELSRRLAHMEQMGTGNPKLVEAEDGLFNQVPQHRNQSRSALLDDGTLDLDSNTLAPRGELPVSQRTSGTFGDPQDYTGTYTGSSNASRLTGLTDTSTNYRGKL